MNASKAIAIGCLAVALVALMGMLGLGAFLYHIAQDPEGIAIAVDAPLDVALDETFPLVVTVTNTREGQTVTINDVDIADEYLAGFVVVSVDPAEQSSMHIPLDNSMSYTFNTELAPGTSKTFTFNLRAQETGIFRGEVDVTQGMQFTSAVAQTVVAEAGAQSTDESVTE